MNDGADAAITHDTLVAARGRLLEQTVAFFTQQPDVIGILLAGSLPDGTSDAYSDIDLRVVATPEGQSRLLRERLASPRQWGDLLFNEWLPGTQHCISHFAPFLKIDVFYWTLDTFVPSPWFRLSTRVLLDRTGVMATVIQQSAKLPFPLPQSAEVSRIVSKALAAAHEAVRRARRGELFYAQSLLEELRAFSIQLDRWIHWSEPKTPQDLKLDPRLSSMIRPGLERSYVGLNADAIEGAVVGPSEGVARQIVAAHGAFTLDRSLATDLRALDMIRARQVGRA